MSKQPKIGLLLIASGFQYHDFVKPFIESARKYFLKGNFDALLWTDSKEKYDVQHTFEIEHAPRPYPTLMRYHFFTSEEDVLKQYTHLFFADIDMKFVAPVGEEIICEGITVTLHPGYALPIDYYAPFEPNPESSAYVPYPKQYFCGGFQGGKANEYLKACNVIKKNIDHDFTIGYIARWHDESHWNRYLIDNPPKKVLTPSYCYPDSFLEYYTKKWGCDYEPKLIALTKKFTLSKEDGEWQNEWKQKNT